MPLAARLRSGLITYLNIRPSGYEPHSAHLYLPAGDALYRFLRGILDTLTHVDLRSLLIAVGRVDDK